MAAVGNLVNTLGTATGVWSNGQLVAGEPGHVSGASNDTNGPQQWDQYIETLTQAMAASSGFERTKLNAQVNDAKKARQNALQIAQLNAETQRYGYDQSRQNIIDQLKENARQFDQNHDLEFQKLGLSREQLAEGARQFNVTSGNQASQFGQTFGEGQRQFNVTSGEQARQFNASNELARANLGLNYAKTATDYLSTPDRHFQAADFTNMAGRALQGLGPQPYGANGAPTPKTTDDFAVLAGYTMPGEGAASGRGADAGRAEQVYAGGSSSFNEGGGSGGQSGTDPRLKAVRAVFDAIPPSNEYGLNDNDYSALMAAKHIYTTNLGPGTLQRMTPGQLAMNRSAGARLGYDVPSWEADYTRYQPGQGSSRAA
jgi:hypothetical protein